MTDLVLSALQTTGVSPGATLAAADNPIAQVVNQAFYSINGWWIWSAHTGTLLLSMIITVGMLWFAARHIGTGPESQGTDRYITRNKFAHMIEVIIVYMRDEVFRPMLGDRTTKFMPILLTFFFFILVNNLIGLVPISKGLWLVDALAADNLKDSWKKQHLLPIGMTATQNLFVTAALAFIAFLVINGAGIARLGIGGYLKHLTADTPVYLWPLMIPIEIAGTIIKPVALAIRLFANMTAGHILMVVLFGFGWTGIALALNGGAGLVLGPGITIASGIGAVAIYFLEIFVAFLQAFVFVFLTTVFIAQLDHHDHEHSHEHGHEGAHHGHERAAVAHA